MNSMLGTSECVELGRKVMSGVEGGRVGVGWIKHCIRCQQSFNARLLSEQASCPGLTESTWHSFPVCNGRNDERCQREVDNKGLEFQLKKVEFHSIRNLWSEEGA